MNRDEALALMQEHTQSPSLRQHMLAVEAAMRAYAAKSGEDVDAWGVVGLLHDFDYEKYPNQEHSATEGHPAWGVGVLREHGLSDAQCRAILGHASYSGVPRDSRLAQTLFAVDELFGGYPTYLGHKFAATWQGLPRPLRRAARWIVDRWPSSTGKMTLEYMLKQFLAATELPWLERHLTWLGAMQIDDGVIAELACKLDRFPHDDALNRVMWFDFLTYLPDDLLVKVDRATMLASVEARAPYLDREVLELVLPAPSSLKVRGFTTKAILKEAARGLVPDQAIRRRKRGLSVPVARWLNTGLAALADRVLARPRLFPGAPTARLLAEHRALHRNNARKLWPLLMAELWAERWNVES